MDQPQITEHALPGVLQTIAGIVGTEEAVKIARDLGGRRFYIPRDLTADHPLSKLIGHPAALTVCGELGGDRYAIPSARPFLRWYDARRLRIAGMSHAQISKALDITQDHVRDLVKDIKPSVVTRGTAE